MYPKHFKSFAGDYEVKMKVVLHLNKTPSQKFLFLNDYSLAYLFTHHQLLQLLPTSTVSPASSPIPATNSSTAKQMDQFQS